MKHELNLNDLKDNNKVLLNVFESVAENKHYVALFKVQKTKSISLHSGIKELLKNVEFSSKCLKFVNEEKNYKEAMETIIINWRRMENWGYEIPTREPDFYIEDIDMKTWFFINERLEISYDGGDYRASRLLEDDMSDTLLFNGGNGWTEYEESSSGSLDYYEAKVAEAYKNFLAERELLDKGKK